MQHSFIIYCVSARMHQLAPRVPEIGESMSAYGCNMSSKGSRYYIEWIFTNQFVRLFTQFVTEPQKYRSKLIHTSCSFDLCIFITTLIH